MRATLLISILVLAGLWSSKAQIFHHSHISKQPDTTQLRLYAQAAEYYYDKNQIDSMGRFVKAGLPLAQKYTNTPHTAPMYYMGAMYYRRRSQYDSSLFFCKKSLSLLTQQKEVNYCVRVRYGLAVILADRSEYAAAFAQSQENIKFYEQHKNYEKLAVTYGLLTYISEELHLKERQVYYNQKQKEVEIFNTVQDNTVVMLMNQGLILEQNKRYKEAYILHDKALNLAIRNQLVYHIPVLYNYLAYNLYLQQKYNSALQMAQLAQSFSVKHQLIVQEINAYLRMREIYEAQGIKLKSLQTAQKAHELALKSSRTDVYISTLTGLIHSQKNNGQLFLALLNQERLLAIKDSLSIQEQALTVSLYEAEQENKLRKIKERDLAKDLKIKQLQLKNLQNDKRLAWTVAIIAFLVVGLAGFFWQRTRSINRQLQAQQQQLQLQTQQLTDSNKIKDTLFGIIGHDLRAPLASFKTQLTYFETQTLSPELRHSFQKLKDSVHQLSILTDNLLFWSLREQERLKALPQSIPLRQLLEEVLLLFVGIINEKSLTVESHVQAGDIYADEQHTRIVLCNILQNAIKFSPPCSTIKLKTELLPDNIIVSVTNTVHPDSPKSTGFGLVLVDELMRQNGANWEINKHSETLFEVILYWPRAST